MTNGDVLKAVVAGLRELGYAVSFNRANNEVTILHRSMEEWLKNPGSRDRYETAILLYSVQDGIFRVRRADGGHAVAKDPWELDIDSADPQALERVTACIDLILSGTYSQPSRITYENWAMSSKPSTTTVINNPAQS